MGALGFVHGVIAGIANPVASGIVKIGLHAVIGDAVSMAQGGSFGTGALTGYCPKFFAHSYLAKRCPVRSSGAFQAVVRLLV